MNPLEEIKEKLKQKPIASKEQIIEIIIPTTTKKQDVKTQKINFIDERKKNVDFDINDLKEKLIEKKLGKVITKETIKLSNIPDKTELEPEPSNKIPIKKAKKILKPSLIIHDEEEDEREERIVTTTKKNKNERTYHRSFGFISSRMG